MMIDARGSINEVATSVLAELRELAIAPLPECYQVWFSYRQNQSPNLSLEINERRRSGEPLDTDFITALYHKHCGIEGLRSALDTQYEGFMGEVVGLQGVAKNLTESANSFDSDIRAISEDVQGLTLSQTELKRFINLLIDTAAKATCRNAQLEEELTSAVQKIGSLHNSIKEIENDAHTDFLTKLANRRRFDKALREAMMLAKKEAAPLSLIVCDVDHFKKFNDTFGHHIGDQVLKFVASVLRKNTKGQDIVARYGGEEFAIALPRTALANAEKVAEQIRVEISRRRLVSKTTNEDLGSITMSFGVSEVHPGATCESLFQAADAALYRAKSSGRNKVLVEETVVRRIA